MFEVWRGVDGQWRFHLKAPNGEIVLASEGYVTKRAALDTVHAIQANASGAEVREVER